MASTTQQSITPSPSSAQSMTDFELTYSKINSRITKDYETKFKKANTVGFTNFSKAFSGAIAIIEHIIAPLENLNTKMFRMFNESEKIIQGANANNTSVEKYVKYSASAQYMGMNNGDFDTMLNTLTENLKSGEPNEFMAQYGGYLNGDRTDLLKQVFEDIKGMAPGLRKTEFIENTLGVSHTKALDNLINNGLDYGADKAFTPQQLNDYVAAIISNADMALQSKHLNIKRQIDDTISKQDVILPSTVKRHDSNERQKNADENKNFLNYKTISMVDQGYEAGKTAARDGMIDTLAPLLKAINALSDTIDLFKKKVSNTPSNKE
ncbi:hypothetical protein AAIR98_001329 [Elusimicrobium simillimum]|uniref:hypothetical protein n=1 Tax=Elusimicrobium simillimum TaxID=3143438 RepID=UPI003C6EB192